MKGEVTIKMNRGREKGYAPYLEPTELLDDRSYHDITNIRLLRSLYAPIDNERRYAEIQTKMKASLMLRTHQLKTFMLILFGCFVVVTIVIASFLHVSDDPSTYNGTGFEWQDFARERSKIYSESFRLRSLHPNATDENEPMLRSEEFPPSNETVPGSKVMACYYTMPRANAILEPSHLDPFLCTHLLVETAAIVNFSLVPSYPNDPKMYVKIMELKKVNPDLKILISVISGLNGQTGFSDVAANQTGIQRFAASSLYFLLEHGFDGIDLDWEFPAWNKPFRQRFQFTDLLRVLRSSYAKPKSGKDLLITAAVAAPKSLVDVSYQVYEIIKYVDFINIMAYDYHSYIWYLPVTGHNAPLFARSNERGPYSTANTAWSAIYWIQKGTPRFKILVGIPLYGHSYRLANADHNVPYSVSSGFGRLGSKGFVSYNDTCWFLQNGATSVVDDESKVPYAYQGDEWVSYDNEWSVQQKADWIKLWGFAGAMVFNLNSDDHHQQCSTSKTNFPLTRAIKQTLNS